MSIWKRCPKVAEALQGLYIRRGLVGRGGRLQLKLLPLSLQQAPRTMDLIGRENATKSRLIRVAWKLACGGRLLTSVLFFYLRSNLRVKEFVERTTTISGDETMEIERDMVGDGSMLKGEPKTGKGDFACLLMF